MPKKKRKPGRPELELPEPIPGPVTPMDLARAISATGPKREDEWKYLRRKRRLNKRRRGRG